MTCHQFSSFETSSLTTFSMQIKRYNIVLILALFLIMPSVLYNVEFELGVGAGSLSSEEETCAAGLDSSTRAAPALYPKWRRNERLRARGKSHLFRLKYRSSGIYIVCRCFLRLIAAGRQVKHAKSSDSFLLWFGDGCTSLPQPYIHIISCRALYFLLWFNQSV